MEERRVLLRGGLPTALLPLPPYFKKLTDFSKCLRCEDHPCVSACEEKIIELKEGFPFLNFAKSGCTFCDKCAEVCPEEVLSVEAKRQKIGEVVVDPNVCIAWKGVVCFSCQDVCEEGAIEFTRGMFNPIILSEKCTGCGFCISVCPEPAALPFFPTEK